MLLQHCFLTRGQKHSECSAATDRTFRFNPTAMIANNPVTDREPKSGTVTTIFSGKKGLENLTQMLRRDADTSV